MPVYDPFSAASKPWRNADSLPSEPLQFAATLSPRDPNIPLRSAHNLPRPRRRDDEHPKKFPVPVYDHARRVSISPVPASPSYIATVGSDQWWKGKVAHCVDNAKCALDVAECHLETLSPRIIDLRDLVTLPRLQSPGSPSTSTTAGGGNFSPRSPLIASGASPRQSPTFSERSFSRTQSAPATAAFFSNLRISEPQQGSTNRTGLLPPPEIASARVSRPAQAGQERRFARSKTGGVQLSHSAPSLAIFARNNQLVSLPTALFEIRNLTVLSLGNNQLTALPAAIGELVNLKELNISTNRIPFLPATILNLNSLEHFNNAGNPWLEPPAPEADSSPEVQSSRKLSPLKSKLGDNVPRLTDLCISVLLSPRLPTHQAPMTWYDWEAPRENGKHPLLYPEVLQELLPASFNHQDMVMILQAIRSAADEAPKSRSRPRYDGIPVLHGPPKPDDAATNPYYNPCPSPRHLEWDVESDSRPTRRVFLHAAEERFEWVNFAGSKNIPIQWLGCSPGCLAFLEEDEEEDWPFEGEDGDGFEWSA